MPRNSAQRGRGLPEAAGLAERLLPSGGDRSLGNPRLSTTILLLVIALFFVAAGLWASYATLDEVTTGHGRVIPSGQVKIVQNLEGGIVADILVREGDLIEEGQVLLRIDDTGFAARYGELRAEYLSLRSAIARLEAMILGGPPEFPPDLLEEKPDLAANDLALLEARRAEFDSGLEILRRQRDQREQELAEAETRLAQLERSYALAHEELELTSPLVAQGVISKVELLRLERQVNDLKGGMEAAELSLPRLWYAFSEAERRIEQRATAMRADTLSELTRLEARLGSVEEALIGEEDRVARREVTSPVKGIVKKIYVTTIGGVLQPGQSILEIVPVEDSLLVEARIVPKDVAFLRPGQEAMVKISAYDYSIYGGLNARLDQISADTIVDENGESFYQIRVRTEQAYLGSKDNPLPIIPGMTATVDILTGKKTVLDYVLKPILKARQTALRER